VGKTLRYRRSVALATLSALGLWPAHFVAMAAPASADSAGQTFSSSWEEYQAYRARAHGGVKPTVADLPDWTGIWQRDSNGLLASFDDSAGVNPMLGRVYGRSTASLTPKYQAAYEAKVANIRVGKEWDRLSNCLPAGFPRMLAEPFLREFIVTPRKPG